MPNGITPTGYTMSLVDAIALVQSKGIKLSPSELGKVLNEKPEGPLLVKQWRYGNTLRTRFNKDNLLQWIEWYKEQQHVRT